MNIAIYARVSKARCNDCGKVEAACTCVEFRGQDTTNQLTQLRAYAAMQGWKVVKEYIDHETGKHGDRMQFQLMYEDSAAGKFKAALCWALDRWTREGIEETFAYIRRLKENGVDFISYTEPHFNTMGPAGELMLAVAAWIAKMERQRISERTKAGLATARLRGKVPGRRAVPVDIRRILALKAAGGKGGSVAGITATLIAEGWKGSRETVRRVLVREEIVTREQ